MTESSQFGMFREKGVLSKSAKSLKLVKEFRFSEKKASFPCLNNIVSRTFSLAETMPFLSTSNVRTLTWPGDKFYAEKISLKCSNLHFDIFVLIQTLTFSFSFVFSGCKLNFIAEQPKEILRF